MNKEIKDYIIVIIFSFVFAISANMFIVPFGLYNGGIIGVAQLLRTLLVSVFKLNINFDLAGIINFLINIPLLIIAYKKFNRSFVIKSIVSVIVQSMAFTIVFNEPIIKDMFASIVVGGLVSGFAISKILVAKASGGGNDIIGMILAEEKSGLSVGKYSLYFNIVIYTICAVAFDLEVAIYSFLFSLVYSYMVDRGHLENLDVSLMIFTKKSEVKEMIMKDNKRGVTTWTGKGAYTNDETEVLVSIVSRYEIPLLKRKIRKIDKDAFVIISNVSDVEGGYDKRLI